jgi:hypothetical protein
LQITEALQYTAGRGNQPLRAVATVALLAEVAVLATD